MSLLFPGVVIVTALLYFFVTPDIARNRHVVLRAFVAIAAGGRQFHPVVYYPAPVHRVQSAALAFDQRSNSPLSEQRPYQQPERVVRLSAFALGSIIFLWICWYNCSFRHDCNPAGSRTERDGCFGPSDIINSSHIRLVSYETARWRSDKVIGSLGYKSEITEPDIQTLNGTLVWITPLDYSGFLIKAWSYADEGTGGYVIVNAEDPKAEAQMVPVNRMIYTRYALLGNEVNRRVWEQHPEFLQMETTFQLDDRMQPKYVIQPG